MAQSGGTYEKENDATHHMIFVQSSIIGFEEYSMLLLPDVWHLFRSVCVLQRLQQQHYRSGLDKSRSATDIYLRAMGKLDTHLVKLNIVIMHTKL